MTKWSVAFAVLSCEVPARSVCLVVGSHGVTDHGSNEIISLQVSSLSKLEQLFFWPAALQHAGMAKASRKCFRRKVFGSSLNVYQHFLMPGLSWTGLSGFKGGGGHGGACPAPPVSVFFFFFRLR